MIMPCNSCTKVPDPAACENKECRRWRKWFVESWNSMGLLQRMQKEAQPKSMEGTVIGGVRYALPHRVQGYLQFDPCEGCACPKDLCVQPCRVKKDWLNVRETLL